MAWNIVTGRTSAGVPVIVDSNPDSLSAGFMIGVKTGSRDESQDIWGLSHLLEHVVFRATDTRTSFQMSKEIEGAGGLMNAFTGKEMTAFYGITLKETAQTAKDLVADIVCNPLIAPGDTEMEKKIVLQEISMCENNPSNYIHDLFAETMWRDHALGHNEAGTSEIVSGLTSEDLRKYYGERYLVPNLAVYASGCVDFDDTVAWAEENLDRMAGGRANPRSAPKVQKGIYRHIERKEDHCYVGIGFPAYDAKSRDRPAAQMLNAVLGSGSSSRMFNQVREQRALVYSIYNYIDQNSDAGSMGTFFSSTEKNVLEAVETVGKVYREFLEEGVTEEELQKARNLVKGATVRQQESLDNRIYSLVSNHMLTGEAKTAEERLALLDSVTVDDVMRVAEDLIRGDRLTVVMYGNEVESMKDFSPDQIEL